MFYFNDFSISNSFFTVYLRRIARYSVASTSEAAFVIGGHAGDQISDVIAKFENDKWSPYGNLRKCRYAHGSITFGTNTLVIGGKPDDWLSGK